MFGKTRVFLMICLVGLLALPAHVQPSAAGTSVYLKASFRDAIDTYGVPTDKLRSDGKGSYKNARDLTVMINSDGEFSFDIGKNSGRRVNLIFNNFLRYGSCGEIPPDTAGTDPAITDEPITLAQFQTNMESYYAGPLVNFLEMQVGEIQEVRIWVVLTTAVRSYFYLNYDQHDLGARTGSVMVHAMDTNGDNIVDRWVLYPKPFTNEMAYLNRIAYTGKNRKICDLGDFRMPFELILDRL